MNLTPNLRVKLKKPLGKLVGETSQAQNYEIIVCVGDVASKTLLEDGYKPKIIVYDAMTMRKPVDLPKTIVDYPGFQVNIENPPATLKQEANDAVKDAVERDGVTKIFVAGEEDLITLAAIKHSPNGSLIVYGQPGEGLVFVEVDDKIKQEVEEMLEEMNNGNPNN